MEEQLFVSTTPGLEAALEGEARSLGAAVSREAGGVSMRGPPGLYALANLRLRTASRVLLRLGQVPLREPFDAALARVPVAAEVGTGVRVRATGAGPLAKLEAAATRLWGGGAGDDAPEVLLRAEGGRCTVSLDTSGEGLHLRGYRQEVSRAPVRETLAAGILLLAGYSGDEPLWDPMCGSGTLAIEGAWLAQHRAPGLARRFAFERFASHDAARWQAELARARAEERPAPFPILAGDLNAGSLGTARRNARRAGLAGELTLERHDATRLEAPAGVVPGLVVANLPYGKRVGDRTELPRLYRDFGAAIRRLKGWRYALLTAEGDERGLGFEPDRALALSNGGLKCRLLLGRVPLEGAGGGR